MAQTNLPVLSRPRLGPYVQGRSVGKDWISMLSLAEPGQNVTHVNLGQWWWAPKRSPWTLFLNDDPWYEPESHSTLGTFNIFHEAKLLQAKGIKVLTQLTFFWGADGFGQDGPFNEHLYGLLHDMLTRSGFDGVDLDVEDSTFVTDNEKVIRLIKRLKKDFGQKFLITMAPGGRELLDKSDPEYGNLSAVYYPDLYKAVGSDIDWFNVQCYNSWGELTLEDFERFVNAGTSKAVYPVHKIVLSVCVNKNDGDGWTDGAQIKANLPLIRQKYPDMGGVSCWEWINAILKDGDPAGKPEEWFRFVYKMLYG